MTKSNPHPEARRSSGSDHLFRGEDHLTTSTATPKPLMTVDEFGRALGGAIGKNTLYELIRANRIRHVRLGRKILIPAKEVAEFLEREANAN